MKVYIGTLAIALGVMAASDGDGLAAAHHLGLHPHHRLSYRHGPTASSAARFDAPGAIVEQATIRAQHEPGVTTEFDPTAKQTATGGPSGGIPSSSGGP